MGYGDTSLASFGTDDFSGVWLTSLVLAQNVDYMSLMPATPRTRVRIVEALPALRGQANQRRTRNEKCIHRCLQPGQAEASGNRCIESVYLQANRVADWFLVDRINPSLLGVHRARLQGGHMQPRWRQTAGRRFERSARQGQINGRRPHFSGVHPLARAFGVG